MKSDFKIAQSFLDLSYTLLFHDFELSIFVRGDVTERQGEEGEALDATSSHQSRTVSFVWLLPMCRSASAFQKGNDSEDIDFSTSI